MIRLSAFRLSVAVLLSLASSPVFAQKAHHFFDSRSPVGQIARAHVGRHPELAVMQPVLVKVPRGALVAVAEGGHFSNAAFNATLVSLQVGEAYRLKVGNISQRSGDVYPTIELLDRMHAPAGKETRYPIPIELTEEELRMALDGKYVQRVIYVENPRKASPLSQLPEQHFFEVMAHEDPLHVASDLGRPVAILRMGSLTPGSKGLTSEFTFGSPPIQRHAMLPSPVRYKPSKLDPSDLPSRAEKRDVQPTAPKLPNADALPDIRIDLPEREAAPPAFGADAVAEEEVPEGDVATDDLFDDEMPAPEVGDDPFGDDLDDAEIDIDPFDEI